MIHMLIDDGLVFRCERYAGGMMISASVECRSEGGKNVTYAYRQFRRQDLRKAGIAEEEIAEAIAALRIWFERHTRPDTKNLADPLHPDAKKRPYKPAGFLRRMTEQELSAPHYADAKRISDAHRAQEAGRDTGGKQGQGGDGPSGVEAGADDHAV
jgi:hypothetical protein